MNRILSLGIRREGKNLWERRVPLTPDHVSRLIHEHNTKVYLQPSTKRVFPDEKYRAVGATISEDLSHVDIVLGVKEVPANELINDKTYMFFSHTHKAQKYNMGMLKTVLDKNIRLLDYELLTNERGERIVQFSRFAGYGGMVDGLHALGHRLLALGHGNPFLAVGMSYMYRCVADARLDVTRTGMVIAEDGLPRELGPLIFVITGHGNVAKGALHIFKCLPHQWVKASELEALRKSTDFDNRKVYICQVGAQDYAHDKDGNFEMSRYLTHPEEYSSNFHKTIAPYATFILNGIFWTSKYPRLLTIAQTKQLSESKLLPLLTLADVSCDYNGSFEFMDRASTISAPFFMYDPISNTYHSDLQKPGVQIMSIDNLPTEMPLEASESFGDALLPVVIKMVKGDFTAPVLQRASITDGKGLTEKHVGLKVPLSEIKKGSRILVLGSGFVAKPLVDYLLRTPSNNITIATNNMKEAVSITQNRPHTSTKNLDITDSDNLGALIKQHDIVVSLVPASLHVPIAQLCIQHKTHLVTASYISPAMQALDQRAKEAGITIMNEIGLDPGIDHLTACQTFEEVRVGKGKVVSFVSWCGGLPSPEVSNNALGYKFSWSPKGVLTAGLNSAVYLDEGKEVSIEGKDLLNRVQDVDILKGLALEGLANRDSLGYIDVYGLDRQYLKTMFRGTLRFKGYAELMHLFKLMGLLDDTKRTDLVGLKWKELTDKLTNGDLTIFLKKHKVDMKLATRLREAVRSLGLDSSSLVQPSNTVLDAFCALLQLKLKYNRHERDMVVMHHEFVVAVEEGKYRKTSTLVVYGDEEGYSAMAKTVGYPAAMATEMILNGEYARKGVRAPITADIYNVMIERLEKEDIIFKDSKVWL